MFKVKIVLLSYNLQILDKSTANCNYPVKISCQSNYIAIVSFQNVNRCIWRRFENVARIKLMNFSLSVALVFSPVDRDQKKLGEQSEKSWLCCL